MGFENRVALLVWVEVALPGELGIWILIQKKFVLIIFVQVLNLFCWSRHVSTTDWPG